LPIGLGGLLNLGELAHQVVFGFDVDEEFPRPAAERRGVFGQRRQ